MTFNVFFVLVAPHKNIVQMNYLHAPSENAAAILPLIVGELTAGRLA